jgi:hypothetical protein
MRAGFSVLRLKTATMPLRRSSFLAVGYFQTGLDGRIAQRD